MTNDSALDSHAEVGDRLGPRESFLAGAVIALQAALFLAPALFTSKVLLPTDLLVSYVPWATGQEVVPQNANLSDQLQQFYPYLHFFRDQVRSGHFPLWNPYVLCGTPFLANTVSAVLFPVTWLVLLIPAETFFEWSAFLKLFLAGLGIYLYSRRSLQVRPLTAWCAATAYTFCGYNIYFLGFPNTYVTMLLPWSLLVLDQGFVHSNKRSRWTFSFLTGAILVAGHIESAALAMLFFLLYLLVLVFDFGSRRMQWSTVGVARLLPFLFHLVWGGLIAGALLFPFGSFLSESATFASRTQATNPFHISLLRLPAMWIPYFFGSPIFNPDQATVSQMEQCIFLGAIPLLLAFCGMSRSLNFRVPAILAGMLLSFLVVFGVWPFFQLFTSLPLLKQGNHIHAIQIFHLCAVLLAALGLERWSVSAPRLSYLPAIFLVAQLGLLVWQWLSFSQFPFLDFESAIPWYGIITLVFLLIFCATQLQPRWAPALLAVLLPSLGFLYGFCFNPASSSQPLSVQTLPGLDKVGRHARIAGIGDGTLLPNMAMTIPVGDLRGYESVVLSRTQHFFNALTGKLDDPQHSIHGVDQSVANVLKQCAVEYLLSPTPLMVTGWLDVSSPGAFLYRAAEPLRRAAFAAEARRSSTEESFRALLDGRTENTVFLETHSISNSPRATGAVTVLEGEPDRLRYQVYAQVPGYLLIRETYDTGWEARLNGKKSELIRANYLFMAVPVPAGDSVVELTYRPWSWIAGLALTLLSLPVAIRGACFGRERRGPKRGL